MSDEQAASNAATNDSAQVAEAPVQNQAPQASEPAEKPSGSTREALERAFKSSGLSTDIDSQPPAVRDRDPATGKFVQKQAEQVTTQQNTAEALAAEQAAKEAAKAPLAPIAHPGLTKEAQTLWNSAPEALRNDVMRRVDELTKGMEQHKAAFEPIRKFDDMAKQSGRTLDAVLTDYVGIENMITQNPVQGFLQICRNLNLNPLAVGQALAGLTPQQMAQPQQQPQSSPEFVELKKQFATLQDQIGQQTIQQSISQFASETDASGEPKHPYFDDLRPSMAKMLETGFAESIPDAYEKAVRLNPEIADRIAKDKAAKEAAQRPQTPDPAQTQDKAKKSITGSPSSASNATSRKPAGSAREALNNAFAQVGL